VDHRCGRRHGAALRGTRRAARDAAAHASRHATLLGGGAPRGACAADRAPPSAK
jgi:hypothetical protein